MMGILAQKILPFLVFTLLSLYWTTPSLAQIGIWSSPAELANLPMSGPAWEAVLAGANQDCSNPAVSNQDDNTNVYILAAAIVYARTGNVIYKNKVVEACEKLVAGEKPLGNTLAWARETGAYAMAADLVGYRTSAFEIWLRNMAEVYVAEDMKTLLQMFKTRPNNWGAHAFGALCAIYRYLGESASLNEIRDYWRRGVVGLPNTGYKFGRDLSWHVDANGPQLINPKAAIKAGMNIDGIIPDDMRRGGNFHDPPAFTGYVWEFMQGQVMAARILARAGLPIWAVGDSALYRAAYTLQVRLENKYGGWAAQGDDEWMLPFLDEAYGTQWSNHQPRLWKHGKNAGWAYVALGQRHHTLTLNTVGSGSVTLNPSDSTYRKGASVTLTAIPVIGWAFNGWRGDLSGLTNPETIIMDANKQVTAAFVEIAAKDPYPPVLKTIADSAANMNEKIANHAAPLFSSFHLEQNYPNPFNRATTISYILSQACPVSLTIYDINGRKISTLVDGLQPAGTYSSLWQRFESDGRPFPNGIYFCRLQAGGVQVKMIKIVLMQ